MLFSGTHNSAIAPFARGFIQQWGTCCLGSDELVYKKRLKPFVIKCIWLERCIPHKFDSKLRGFPFTLRTNTVGHIFDSHKWSTVLARKVKGKPHNFEASVDHCILLLKHLSNHMHFITNGFKRFLYTNSSDPRQRVPLINMSMFAISTSSIHCALNLLSLNILLCKECCMKSFHELCHCYWIIITISS